MVQREGSPHDWFEGRRGKCVLMVIMDDATNRRWTRFFEEKPTHPASLQTATQTGEINEQQQLTQREHSLISSKPHAVELAVQ
jgi:hypothetical protein